MWLQVMARLHSVFHMAKDASFIVSVAEEMIPRSQAARVTIPVKSPIPNPWIAIRLGWQLIVTVARFSFEMFIGVSLKNLALIS